MKIDPKKAPKPADALALRTWLANDLETVVPGFLDAAANIVGAIYHLTDGLWIIPALSAFSTKHGASLVYDAKKLKKKGKPIPNPNDGALAELTKVKFLPRDKTNIMHNKFMVSGAKLAAVNSAAPARLVCGSANYTTEGLTSQANLMHTFDSPELARFYLERFRALSGNPTVKETAGDGPGWSDTVTVGDAGVRVIFSPEPTGKRISIDTIVKAIHGARSSVLFCLFMPTDKELRDASFAAGDNGKMMFGLVNAISAPKDPTDEGATLRADKLAAIELYHRSRDNRDVIGAEYFHPNTVPKGFELEYRQFPGEKPPSYPPVIIHHKFVIIDAETDTPIVYSGSANMSENSVHKNDENLLEIRGSRRIAGIYLAEFMRLYEHYRARAQWIASRRPTAKADDTFKLQGDSSWSAKHFKPGTPECKARVRMAEHG
jgi:phosphatidylserine/phosphatidylglycerophosphate/cardiolipin synthase-like enzyme